MSNYLKYIVFIYFCICNKFVASQCSFNLGEDVLFCQEQPVKAYFEAPQGYNSYKWNTGEVSQGITINSAGTYICTGTILSADLIANGNFSLGTSDFSSSYSIGTGGTYGLLSLASTYCVSTNPSTAHTAFPSFGDHTSGNGPMLLVNGSGVPNSSVWCQNVTVTPNTDYNFSTWVATCVASSNAELAKLQFSINGSLLGSTFSPSITSGQWLPFYATWNSGNSTSASICIVNQNTELNGNDFALDDIFFQKVCTYSDTVNVKVGPLSTPTISPSGILTCITPSVTLNVSFLVSGSIYSWVGPAGFTSSIQNPVVSTAGMYTVTITTPSGCKTSASITITSNTEAPQLSAGTDQVLDCKKKSVTLNGSSSTPGILFNWSGPFFSSALPAPSVSATGTYTLTVTDAVNGCSSSAIVNVSNDAAMPDVHAGQDRSLTCATTNVSLSGLSITKGVQYLWNGPGGFSANMPIVNVSTIGTYTLTVTNPINGCTASSTINVTGDFILPDVRAGADRSLTCSITTVPLSGASATNGVQYFWNGPGGFTSTQPTVPVSLPGTYILTAKNPVNGCVAMDSMILFPATSPIVSTITKKDVNCYKGSSGTAVVQILSGGTAPFAYHWNTGATTATLSSLVAGNYSCIVKDALGCTDTLSTVVAEPPPLALSPINSQTICFGQSVIVSPVASGGIPTYEYTIFDSNFIEVGDTITPAVSTDYFAIATDQHGCISEAQNFSIKLFPAFSIKFSDITPVCQGQCVTIAVNAKGGKGNYAYMWSPGNETTSFVKVCPAITTSYTVNVSDACGNKQSEITVPVVPLPQPDIIFTDTAACAPLCLDIRVDGVPGMTYNWYVDNDNKSHAAGFSECLPEGEHAIRINVVNSLGCIGADTLKVKSYPKPKAIFSYSPEHPSVLNQKVNFINESLGATTYLWDFGTGQQSANTNPLYEYPAVKNCYTITLQALNEYGCTSETTNEICIKDMFTIYFPNAFSPDNDGINDTFRPKGVGIDTANYLFLIYDRWGNELFETTEFEKGWDGKCLHKDDSQLIDCYVWKCNLRDINGNPHEYKGIVTIVK